MNRFDKFLLTGLWVITGTVGGLIGLTLIIGHRIHHDNDMHPWVFYAAPAGAILGGGAASAIASHFNRNYKIAGFACLVTATIFAVFHYYLFGSTLDAELLQEIAPALICYGLLLLYGLLLMAKVFSQKP